MSDASDQVLAHNEVTAETRPHQPPLAENNRRLRTAELCLVLFVAFAGALSLSVYTALTGAHVYASTPSRALNFGAVIQELAGLGVLFYVLFRQGRRPKDLGFTFSWTDLPLSVGVAIMALIVEVVAMQVLLRGYYLATGHNLNTTPQNVEFVSSGSAVWTLVLIFINPFFEELIVRAYLMSELQSLTGSSVVAVVFSVALQSTYHLYQGLSSALISAALFTVFSIYYIKTRRIVPVILAHFYFDLMAVAYYWWP
jgi:membrane protease YdiL (CAAX protease family)